MLNTTITHRVNQSINQMYLLSPFYITDVTKCCTETKPKPQTASNADVEAQWLGKTP